MNTRTQIGGCDPSRPGRGSALAQNLGIWFSCCRAKLAERQRALQASTKLTGFAGKLGKPRGCSTLIGSGCDRNNGRLAVE